MSSERNINPFSALLLVISIIGLVTVIIGPFAGFYLIPLGNRYSCLDCGYTTALDFVAQILVIIFLLIQVILALSDLLPKKITEMDLSKFGFIFAILTISFTLIGFAAFGITYAEYDWWPELGFYGAIIAGIINLLLNYLNYRNR